MEQDYTLAAKQQSVGYGNEVRPAPAPPWTDELGARLNGIYENLHNALADLSMLHERMFGPQPTGNQSASKDRPQGRVNEISAMLDELTGRSIELTSLARGLNGRL